VRVIKAGATRSRLEGLAILLVALGYIWEARNVPDFYHMPGVPGPTTFPYILGIVFRAGRAVAAPLACGPARPLQAFRSGRGARTHPPPPAAGVSCVGRAELGTSTPCGP